jgi:hypothetical protein
MSALLAKTVDDSHREDLPHAGRGANPDLERPVASGGLCRTSLSKIRKIRFENLSHSWHFALFRVLLQLLEAKSISHQTSYAAVSLVRPP